MKSNAKIKFLMAFFAVIPAFAVANPFENSPAPADEKTNGGCGTISKVEVVTDRAPVFSDRMPNEGSIGSGSDITQIAANIPGIGAVAAAVIGVAAASVVNANNVETPQDRDKKAVVSGYKNVYLIAVKSDFGKDFETVFEFLHQSTPKVGMRIGVAPYIHNPNAGSAYLLDGFLTGLPAFDPANLPGKYISRCYWNGKYGYGQLVPTENGFDWDVVPPEVQALIDAKAKK